jgi:aspartate aminotransferase
MSSKLFESLKVCPDDPILQLMALAREDKNPLKVDLSAGVYKDEQSLTPVMDCVKEAERRRLEQEQTKTYMGLAGDLRFDGLVSKLALGDSHPALLENRVSTIQTTGGSGAIRLAAELFKKIKRGSTVWVSDPTWANHIPLLKSADNEIATYAYYRHGESGVRFSEILDQIGAAEEGDVILLQGSCHNPCGEDLNFDQWKQLTGLVQTKSLLPFVDIAYHGLAEDLDLDAQGWRYMAEHVPEMLISYSGSKNFSLYRDRVGALISISANKETAHKTLTNMMTISRVLYSMPPAHGANLVAEILGDSELRNAWMDELNEVRSRIQGVRTDFADALLNKIGSDRFEFIRGQKGMFSFLGISAEQVQRMRRTHSIYLLDSSRMNIAGLTSDNLNHVAEAVASVI